MFIDLLLVGRLVEAEKQIRPHLLARQRGQFEDDRFRRFRHVLSLKSRLTAENAENAENAEKDKCSFLFPLFLSAFSGSPRWVSYAAIDRQASIFLSICSDNSRIERLCSSLTTSGPHFRVMRCSFWNSRNKSRITSRTADQLIW